MTHREKLKEYLSEIKISNCKVIDWGSGSKPAWRYIGEDNNNDWVTIDNAPGIPEDRKRNHLDIDISRSVYLQTLSDVSFCLEVLEHVEQPYVLIENLYNNTKAGGKLYLSVPFKYQIHAEADYWRFTKHGIKLLLEQVGFKVDSIKETVDELGYFVEASR